MMILLTLVLALLVAVGTIIFSVGNPGVIPVHFLSWSFDSSLTPLLLGALAVGLILGVLITIPSSIRKSFTIAGNNRKNERLEKEILSKPGP